MSMTPERWAATNDYLSTVFGRQDEHLASIMPRAIAAGLPDIAVSAGVGRMLLTLARLIEAKLIIEVGTLAGYSGIWLARGLAPGGRLITVDLNEKHAAFAKREFESADVSDRVEQRLGAGLAVLTQLNDELGPGAADMIFLDADKAEYADDLPLVRRLLRPGGLLVVDNALGSDSWWIDDAPGSNPARDAMDDVNRTIAAADDFEAFGAPIRQGVLVAMKVR